MVCLSLLLEYFHCRTTGRRQDECVNPTRQMRWSTSLQVLAPPHSRRRPRRCRWPPRLASRVRASFWARAPSSPRYTAAPVDAPLRSVCRASPCCSKPCRTAAADAPDAFAAALAALIDTTRGTPRDKGIRFSTWTWYTTHTRATFVTEGSLGHDEHALPGRAFLAPAPSRAAAHVMITRKEIRCTRCHPPKK